jgi:hypothetical protein
VRPGPERRRVVEAARRGDERPFKRLVTAPLVLTRCAAGPAEHSHAPAHGFTPSVAAPPSSGKGRIGSYVGRLIDVLTQAGTLVSAGESLLPPLRTLAAWLGAAGLGALRLLA